MIIQNQLAELKLNTASIVIECAYLVLPTGETEMTELMEGVGDVGLEEAEDEADNGRIWKWDQCLLFIIHDQKW